MTKEKSTNISYELSQGPRARTTLETGKVCDGADLLLASSEKRINPEIKSRISKLFYPFLILINSYL